MYTRLFHKKSLKCFRMRKNRKLIHKIQIPIKEEKTIKYLKYFRWGVLFSAFLFFLSNNGTTYYVATFGNNENSGIQKNPWATPGYGSRQLHPGDTLLILGGRYVLSEYDGDILMPASGIASRWITILGEKKNPPVLAGRNNLITAIDLSGKSYIRIENLEITHDDNAKGATCWFRDGIEVLGEPGRHLVFQNLYVHHLDEFGMNLQDIEAVEILNCRIEYCGFGALGGPLGEHGGWQNVTIRDCFLSYSGHYYQGGDGSNRPYDRPDGFGIERSSGPILIEKTKAEHNAGDGLDSKAAHTTIRQCIVANNSCDGIKLWGVESRIENTLIYGRGDGNPEPSPWAAIVIAPEEQANGHFEIVHVTVDDSLGDNYLMYVQYDHPQVPVHVTIRNSIFSARGPDCPICMNPAGTLVLQNILFFFPQCEVILTHGEKQYTCSEIGSFGPGNACGNPQFVQPAWGSEGEYHLRQGSPAIDAGEAGLGVDLEGKARDSRPDLGAYEFFPEEEIPFNSKSFPYSFSLFQNYPNPFNSSTTIEFVLPKSAFVMLKIYNLLGQEVATLVEDPRPAGIHKFNWNAEILATGMYLCRLSVVPFLAGTWEGYIYTKKLILIR